MLQTIGTRVVTLGVNVVLSRWLLQKEDFALVAMAQSMCTVFSLLQPSNLGDLLIQRRREFQRWGNSAFWLSITAGMAIFTTAMILAPIGGLAFHRSTVPWLVLVAGTSSAVNSVGAVFLARQSMGFHFRRVAAIATVSSLVAATLMVIMALLGCGPFSLTVPLVVSTALTVGLNAKTSDFRPYWGFSVARWREMLKDAMLLSLITFFSLVALQGDNFFMGIYRPDELGNYAWAYSLSFQFVQLSAGSLRGAMLPALSTINNDRERVEIALRRAVSLMALLGMPACLLMVPAIPSVVRFIFSAKWDGSIELIQIFLPSMGFVIVSAILTITVQARGFYRRYMIMSALCAVLFVACVWPAAAFGGARQVAWAVSIVYVLTTFPSIAIATQGSQWQYRLGILKTTFIPFVLASVCAVIAWYCRCRTPWDVHDWRNGVVSLAVGVPLYVVAALVFLKEDVRLAKERFQSTLARFRQG
jgi:PST family polysaccharide transporter